MKLITTTCCALGLLGVLLAGVGCQSGQFVQTGTQSGFNYPNSNVTALGPVKAEVSTGVSFGMPEFMTSEIDNRLFNAALSKAEGANLIIDYTKVTRLYSFPGIPIQWASVEIQGTAAKAEVGTQELH